MAKAIIGRQENIHMVKDLQFKGPEGESLYLGYKTTGYFLGAGVYLSDDGYVIGVAGKEGAYYPMPAAGKVEMLQQVGAFPNPLPPYAISGMDYAIGYSAWLLLLGIATWQIVAKKFAKEKSAHKSNLAEP